MKFKSLLSFLLFLLSSAVFAVETVTVNDGEYKGWVFIKNGDGTYSLISIPGGYDPVGGVLTIPDKIDDITVSGVVAQDTMGIVGHIENGVFSSNPNIKEVVINSHIKSIGSNAFAYCSDLTKVTFNSGVNIEAIGDYAFAGCTSLASIKLPEGVKVIGQCAFQSCKMLKSVTFPSSLVSIGSSAFQWCTVLDNVKFPSSLASIGSYAFEQCSTLKAVTIPASVNVIGQNAFQYCYALASVTIEDSKTNQNRVIEQWAFTQTAVSSIYIPGSVSVVQNNAFDCCSNLSTVVIGDGVDEIQSGAFGKCGKLSNVTFQAKSNPPTIAVGAFTDWLISNGNVTITPPSDADYEINLKDGSLSVSKKEETENPDPENPAPENPDPENPNPENPNPENPNPENPNPGNSTSVKESSASVSPVAYYSLSGARLSAPLRGSVAIAVYSDGSARKLLVR